MNVSPMITRQTVLFQTKERRRCPSTWAGQRGEEVCRAVRPGGAASDGGEQWRAVPGVGVPAGDVRREGPGQPC